MDVVGRVDVSPQSLVECGRRLGDVAEEMGTDVAAGLYAGIDAGGQPVLPAGVAAIRGLSERMVAHLTQLGSGLSMVAGNLDRAAAYYAGADERAARRLAGD